MIARVWQQHQAWIRPVVVGVGFVAVNIWLYLALQSPAGQAAIAQLASLAAPGAFLLMLAANATVVVPIPWPAVLLPLAQQSPTVWPIVLAAALGSVVGESVAYGVGRSGQAVIADSPMSRWVRRQLAHPWRAFFALVVLAAPPNPLFDVAGLAAGATGVPFWLFFGAVLLARIARFAVLLTVGIRLLGD